MTIKEITKAFPLGCLIIDPYGNKRIIRNHKIEVSKFKQIGTLILGGQYIYDAESKKWAVKI